MFSISKRCDHTTCSFSQCNYFCTDKYFLLRKYQWISNGFSYRRNSSLYLQLEYFTGTDFCNRIQSYCRKLRSNDYRCTWLFSNCICYDQRSASSIECKHFSTHKYFLLRWKQPQCNSFCEWRNSSLYLQLEYNTGADFCKHQ